MNNPKQSDWNIRRKMLVLAVIPLALITSLLTGYFIWSSQDAVRELFVKEGRDVSRYLAKVSEFHMFSGDIESLRNFGAVVVTENNVDSVIFFDPEGNTLTRIGKTQSPALKDTAISKKGSVWFFQQPIQYSAIEVDDFSVSENTPEESTEEAQILGWVQITLNETVLVAEQRQILIAGISIAGIGLAIAVMMALRLGRGITTPLSRLSDTVQQLESGDLSARAPQLSGYEFRILAQGLNRMAERIDHANEELQQRVKEATQQLTETLEDLERQNKKLEHTRKELITADQAKDEFLARMSHELRTPLTSILGYSKLLDELGLEEEQQEFNHIIRQSSDLLLSVINDILDFTKLRSNAIRLEQLPFNLESCLEDLVAMHAHRAFEKNLELVLLIESDVPAQVIGDELRLRQIINNLISNAIKFTLEGEVVLTTAVESLREREVILSIQVKDSGIGIKHEDLDNLFKEFSQADVSITRRFGGSGLGLVIVKRLAQLMEGDIQLTSASGSGTEVTCTLTLQVDTESGSYLGETPFGAEQILIYDRNPWSLRALRHLTLNRTTRITTVTDQASLIERVTIPAAQFSAIVIGLGQEELEEEPLEQFLTGLRSQCPYPILLVGSAAVLPLQQNSERWQEFQPIDFISKPSRGSLFSERLLALIDPDYSQQLIAGKSTHADTPKISSDKRLQGARVLIAEDNEFNRQLIVRLLEATGAEVTQASNGAEAVDAYNNDPADILLLDLNMPEMDGYQAAQAIRQKQANDKITFIVALTAAISNQVHQDEKMKLFDTLLYKPIREEELISTLDRFWNPVTERDTESGSFLIKVSEDDLKQEVFRLSGELESAIEAMARDQIKHFAHQLLGIIATEAYREIAELASIIETSAQQATEEALIEQSNRLRGLLADSFKDR